MRFYTSLVEIRPFVTAILLVLGMSGLSEAPFSRWAIAATPLSLEQIYRAALEKSEPLGQQREQITQTEARIARGRGGLFPELSFNVDHLIQPTPDDPIAREFSPAQQTTVSLMGRQPIFRGFREFAAIRQERQIASAQTAMLEQSKRALYQEVAIHYLNVLMYEQDLRNLREQAQIYQKRTAEIGQRTRRGESSTTELLSAQSTLRALEADIRLVQSQVVNAREMLSSLTGVSREAELSSLAERSKPIAPNPLTEYLKTIENRPDLKSAIALRDAADEGISVARGAHLPTIDAVGNYYLTRPGFLSDIRWDVALRVSLPLFSGGSTVAQVRESSSKLKETELEVARLRRIAETEIRTLYESWNARIEQLDLLQQSAELAEKNVSVSQTEFRRGLTRSIDVQVALGEYRVARRAFDQALFAAQIEQIKLEVASGRNIPTQELSARSPHSTKTDESSTRLTGFRP